MSVNQRLKLLRKTLELNQTEFAERIGITQTSVSQLESGANGISYDVFRAVVNNLRVDPLWLMEGNGEIFHQKTVPNSVPIAVPNQVNEPESLVKYKIGQPVAITVDDKGDENIVLVDVKCAAGYVTSRLEPTFYSKLPVFKLPGSEFRNGSFRMFEVQGDSMFNTLWPGDWVIASLVTDPDKGLKNGYIHVIVTKNDIVIKRLLNRIEKRGKLTLISDNQDYPGYELDIEEVQEIWYVVRRITAQMPSSNRDLQKVITTLKSDIINLQERVDKLEGK